MELLVPNIRTSTAFQAASLVPMSLFSGIGLRETPVALTKAMISIRGLLDLKTSTRSTPALPSQILESEMNSFGTVPKVRRLIETHRQHNFSMTITYMLFQLKSFRTKTRLQLPRAAHHQLQQ
jgi:hypothetical protein